MRTRSASKNINEKNNQNNSHWSEEQNLQYLMFLQQNLQQHGDSNERRPKYFFKRMEQFVASGRSNEHCRSHHQKLLKKHKNVQNIVAHFREKLFESKEEEPSHENFNTTFSSRQQLPNYFEGENQSPFTFNQRTPQFYGGNIRSHHHQAEPYLRQWKFKPVVPRQSPFLNEQNDMRFYHDYYPGHQDYNSGRNFGNGGPFFGR